VKAFWIGGGQTPNADYQYLGGAGSPFWSATEAERSNVLSEDVIITKLTVWTTNAVGVNGSWVYTIRANAVDTAVTVAITGTGAANQTGSWSGSVAISASSLVNMVARVVGTPTVPSITYWIIEYTTVGNFYLMLGGNPGTTSNSAVTYLHPCGAANYTPSTTAGFHEGQAPSPFTVTKIAANVSVAPGVGKSHTFTPLFNRVTDATFSAVISGATTVAVSSPGTLAFTTEALAIKHSPAGTPAASTVATCLTIVPGVPGELVWFLSFNTALSTTATDYASFGPGGFAGGENANTGRWPACTMKKLIATIGVAPGVGKSHTFTMRSDFVDTAVVVPLVDTTMRGVDSVHTATHVGGNFLGIKHVPVGTPAANSATGCFFVTLFDQGDSTKFFAFF